jgi:hypothetical protein
LRYHDQYKTLYEGQKKKYEQLKKDYESLKRQFLLIPDRFELKDRELAIIEYIRKHPGTTKIDLISKLQNSVGKKLNEHQYGTYVTLLKSIGFLAELNIIRIEKVHKQKHKLYLNENSLLLGVHNDLLNFKNSFDELLDKVEKNTEWQQLRNTRIFGSDRMLYYLGLIYRHVFNVYLSYILQKWSVELMNDDLLLNRVNTLVLFSFVEIGTKFAKKFDLVNKLPEVGKETWDDIRSPLLLQTAPSGFLLDPYTIMAIIKEFYRFGLHRDVVPLINVSWRIGLNLYRFIEMHFLSQFKPQIMEALTEDWKQLLGSYLQRKFEINPLNGFEFRSQFEQPEWFHRDKNLMRDILIQVVNSNNRK